MDLRIQFCSHTIDVNIVVVAVVKVVHVAKGCLEIITKRGMKEQEEVESAVLMFQICNRLKRNLKELRTQKMQADKVREKER